MYIFFSLHCSSSYWVPAPKPLIYHPAKITLIDQKLTDINRRSLTFKVTGKNEEICILSHTSVIPHLFNIH